MAGGGGEGEASSVGKGRARSFLTGCQRASKEPPDKHQLSPHNHLSLAPCFLALASAVSWESRRSEVEFT